MSKSDSEMNRMDMFEASAQTDSGISKLVNGFSRFVLHKLCGCVIDNAESEKRSRKAAEKKPMSLAE